MPTCICLRVAVVILAIVMVIMNVKRTRKIGRIKYNYQATGFAKANKRLKKNGRSRFYDLLY